MNTLDDMDNIDKEAYKDALDTIALPPPPSPPLTPHQLDAIGWLTAAVRRGEPLVALRGLAGTGKTTLIPTLQASLKALHIPSVVGSPTHRAAAILRKKGIKEASTVHSLALVPYFDADYRRAMAWLGELLPSKLDDVSEAHADVEGFPWLVWDAVQPDLGRARNLLRRGSHYKAQRLLASIGISGKEHFTGFGPKEGEGVLIIDEASMVGRALLDLCQQAYPQIILVGDPGQLPPVKDEPILWQVPGVELTEIHRQAADSPIVQLAYRARQGEQFWRQSLQQPSLETPDDVIRRVTQVEAQQFRTAPLLVWRNEVRIACIRAIRQALGYARDTLYVGEPLVCRSSAQEDRALGFFNNGLYTIASIDPEHPRRVQLLDDLGNLETIIVHVEEQDSGDPPPQSIPFRFAYAFTTHTAQGGEWPLVHISVPELNLFDGIKRKRDQLEEVTQWTYTAITRAKDRLRFLTAHRFLGAEGVVEPEKKERTRMPRTAQTITPPSAPLLGMTPAEQDIFGEDPTPLVVTPPEASPVPLLDDDIADPPVPGTIQTVLPPAETAQEAPGATQPQGAIETLPVLQDASWAQHEALLHGFCAVLQERVSGFLVEQHRGVMQTLDATLLSLKEWMQQASSPNEHAQYQLATALAAVQEQGVQLRHDPYQCSVQTVSPQGFAVTITMAKGSADELVGALPALMGWLAQEGYKPVF